MDYVKLGRTDLTIPRITLGTMTWGEQNTQAEADEQMDYALAQGINCFDAAEMYPVPANPKTHGRTETIIGNWFKARGNRSKVTMATKVIGRGAWLPGIRGGEGHPNRAQIVEAVEGSLRRLQTDYIDLYQIHWPDRPTNYFGQLGYTQVSDETAWTPIEETLEALDTLVKQGKIRHAGVSNETPWGLMRYLALAEKHGWTRIASIQNPYSLLNRSYEIGLAEISHREQVGLLAYSPLAFGALSGKYVDGSKPEGARLTRWGHYFTRYLTPRAQQATAAYVQLAYIYMLDPSQMALAFVHSRPFVTSTIIGATSMAQLRGNIASYDLKLDTEVLKEIEALYTEFQTAAP